MQELIDLTYERGLDVMGIFRLSGSKPKIDDVKYKLDRRTFFDFF